MTKAEKIAECEASFDRCVNEANALMAQGKHNMAAGKINSAVVYKEIIRALLEVEG